MIIFRDNLLNEDAILRWNWTYNPLCPRLSKMYPFLANLISDKGHKTTSAWTFSSFPLLAFGGCIRDNLNSKDFWPNLFQLIDGEIFQQRFVYDTFNPYTNSVLPTSISGSTFHLFPLEATTLVIFLKRSIHCQKFNLYEVRFRVILGAISSSS